MPPDWYRRKPRKRIQPDDKVPLRLSGRERELIADETFAPDYLTNRLRLVPVGEKRPVHRAVSGAQGRAGGGPGKLG